ncbi:MAG: hypothetical protein ACUVUE_01605, partial [Candidatus Bathycorpusculaceae bacterium]
SQSFLKRVNQSLLSKVTLTLSGRNIRISPSILGYVEALLLSEGFRHTRWQKWERGQVFGLVKRLSFKKQLHIRAFTDGTLKAEEEIWRFLFPLHLIVRPDFETATKKLRALLKKYAPFLSLKL